MAARDCYAFTVRDEAAQPRDALIAWEGDSKEIISGFPNKVRQNLGFQLRLLQQGQQPKDYRPMPSIGPGVFELRDEDARAWYRVVYLSRIRGLIHVLHCFEKKGREMPQKEISMARQRLRTVRARMMEEKKHGKPPQ
jgi:phage-related protein